MEGISLMYSDSRLQKSLPETKYYEAETPIPHATIIIISFP